MKRTVKRLGCKVLLLAVGVMAIALALTWLYSERIVDRSILTDSPCAAPCWQGIVPGMPMEKDKVIQLLETLPNVSSIWENKVPKGTAIMWSWKPWPWRQTGAGYNSVFLMEGVVHHVTLSVDFDLTIEEVLNKYGLPEATNYGSPPLPEEPYVWMNLLYPTQGLWFRAKVYTRVDPVLEPTTRVFEVTYSVPADSLESWLGPSIDTMQLQPWPGYGKLRVPDP